MNTVAETPFVGLRPFDQGDRRWFFGREKEAASLTRLVRTSPFTAVVGGSGTGKSSLVRAGVLPQLTEQGWRAIIAKPGAAPIERLAQALAATDDGLDDRMAAARRYRFDSRLRASAFGLAEIERSIDPAAPELVLVIDQFEELFRFGEEASGTTRAAMREESRAYVELLLNAASGQQRRLRVVITMRSDFFGECSAYAGLAEAVSRAQYLVPLPSRDQLEKAIREPIAVRGAAIDEPLVQRLLIDVEEATDRLPTLQHTLRRLWEAASGEPRRLSEADYLAVGKLEGSIDQAAERATRQLVEENAADQDTLERVMKALTQLDHHDRATRRPQRRSALLALVAEGMAQKDDASASLDRVLKALSAEAVSFLAVGGGADPEVDIGHEALIRSWRRLAGAERDFKSGWLREEYLDGEEWRELLRRAEGQRLLGLQDLRRSKEWLANKGLGPEWTERHGNGWDAVRRFRRRSARKSGIMIVLLLSVFSMFLGSGFFVASSWRAESQRYAEESLRFARAGALATAGYARNFAARGDSRTAALVALAVLPESRLTNDDRYLPEVEAALADALSRPFEAMRLVGHEREVRAVAFSPDGRRVVSGGVDSRLRLWDAATGASIDGPLSGHEGGILAVAFSPDGRHVVSGGMDSRLHVWDVAAGTSISGPLSAHQGGISAAAFSPDGRRIVSGGTDSRLRLWDVATGASIGGPLSGHEGRISAVAFSPDGRHVVSGGDDRMLRVWDAATGASIGGPLSGHEGRILAVAFSPDGRRIVSGGDDRMLRVWDAATGASIGAPLAAHQSWTLAVAASPDGRTIASGGADRTLRFWDSETRSEIGMAMAGADGAIWTVAFDPGGALIISGGAYGTLRFWDARTTEQIREPIISDHGMVTTVAFSPDGRRFLSGGADGTLRLWDVATGAPVSEPMVGHQGPVLAVAFAPDGLRIVSGGADGLLRLWDATMAAPIGKPLRSHDGLVTTVAFSPSGGKIASGGDDALLRLWDANAATRLGEPLVGHTGRVRALAFSPDGRRIASGADDRTIRFWDVTTGAAIGERIIGHDGWVFAVAFTSDGRQVVSGGADGTLRFWQTQHLMAPLSELAVQGERLCPLNEMERRRIRLFDPEFPTVADQSLTDAQRQACGERVP